MTVPPPLVYVVDDDAAVRESLVWMLAAAGYRTRTYPTGEAFLSACETNARGCLLLDVRLPGLNGLQVQQELARRENRLRVIVMSGHADVPMAVQAFMQSAAGFLEKPINPEELHSSLSRVLTHEAEDCRRCAEGDAAALRAAALTQRESEILTGIVAGRTSKQIASDLGLSPRTVEAHRARILTKMRADTTAELIKLALPFIHLYSPRA